MIATIDIPCGEGDGAYTVSLISHQSNRLEKALAKADKAGAAGEARVAKILETPGAVFMLRRLKNGALNDGPNGEPGAELYEGKGAGLSHVAHYKGGKLHDGVNGEAAAQSYNSRGDIVTITHYAEGRVNDTADGRPAIQKFRVKDHRTRKGNNLLSTRGLRLIEKHYRTDGQLQDNGAEAALQRFADNGQIVLKEYHTGGLINDGPRGEPGHQAFAKDGTLISRRYYTAQHLNDPPSGLAALLEIREGGRVVETAHCRDGFYVEGPDGAPALHTVDIVAGVVRMVKHCDAQGRLQDTADGTPALREFNRRSGTTKYSHYNAGVITDTVEVNADGGVIAREHRPNDVLTDAADGTPAVVKLDGKGNVVSATHYKDGQKQRALGSFACYRLSQKLKL